MQGGAAPRSHTQIGGASRRRASRSEYAVSSAVSSGRTTPSRRQRRPDTRHKSSSFWQGAPIENRTRYAAPNASDRACPTHLHNGFPRYAKELPEWLDQLSCVQARRDAGYSIEEARAAGYVQGLAGAGYSCAEAVAVGYMHDPPIRNPDGTTMPPMHAAGFTAADMRAAGATGEEVRAAQYTLADAQQGGYTLDECRRAGYAVPKEQAPKGASPSRRASKAERGGRGRPVPIDSNASASPEQAGREGRGSFSVSVPPGMSPGQLFEAVLDGQVTRVTVPRGARECEELHVDATGAVTDMPGCGTVIEEEPVAYQRVGQPMNQSPSGRRPSLDGSSKVRVGTDGGQRWEGVRTAVAATDRFKAAGSRVADMRAQAERVVEASYRPAASTLFSTAEAAPLEETPGWRGRQGRDWVNVGVPDWVVNIDPRENEFAPAPPAPTRGDGTPRTPRPAPAFSISVPAGALVGEQFDAVLDDKVVRVTVPQGAGPGFALHVMANGTVISRSTKAAQRDSNSQSPDP